MKKFLLSLVFISFLSGLYAQFSNINNYVTRTWTSADGLPGNVVADIVQSADGYLYFGTYECLVKFDGFEFEATNKYSDPNLSFISARSVFEDSSGFMWIGSNDEGVQIIGKNHFVKHISVAQGLPNNSIRAFAEDFSNNVWVGTASGVVYVTPDGQIVVPRAASNIDISHVIVNDLYCDTAGRIWMTTNEINGLYVYTDSEFKHYAGLDSFSDYFANTVTQDKNGVYWISLGNDGIVKVQNGNVSKIKSDTFLDSTPTYSIYCDDSGSMWFGTEKGLVLYSGGDFSIYDQNNQISNTSINKIIGDREGNIWVATDNMGIGKISPGKFIMNHLDYSINSICQDNSGLVWIGSDEGLLCYDNELLVTNNLTEFCKNVRVRHVGLAKNGDLLVNCYSEPAMVRYSDGKILNWTKDDGLAGNKTRVSIEIDNGDLYCGTTTGLSIIDNKGQIKSFTTADGFDCEYIMWLYQDNYGIVWVGTDGDGIYLMKNGKIFRKISTNNGLCGNVIFKISQDLKGDYWICTGSGISLFKGSDKDLLDVNKNLKFFNFTSAHGLGSDSIFQTIIDENNYVWMVSNRGISSVDYNSLMDVAAGLKEKVDCKFYNQNDGLKSSGVNSTALSMKDKYGRIWFTMADGFAVYDPVRNKSSNVLPIIQLVEVSVDDKIYKEFDQPIVIPPGAKHINIKYTGLSYKSSEQNRFIHKLEGFDNEFCEPTASRIVSYTNLRHGKYKFQVFCQNGDGLLSQGSASVDLIQQAYIYQKPMFWIAVAFIFLCIVAITFIVVIQNNKKRQLRLETKIQMATIELQMAKDDSDRLLLNILPYSIAERLKAKGKGDYGTIADRFENVTVLFSDIVNFTSTTSNHTAREIVEALNSLIQRFDNSAKRIGVEKIKTIGDAYMAACGVPYPNKYHSELMLKFAMQMYKDLADYNKNSKIKFEIRIGMNSGPVIAGVIGKNKFVYDIWGDTVNVASRMESNCNPRHIRMTQSVVDNLRSHGHNLKFKVEEINVKGKGLMKTYEFPEK